LAPVIESILRAQMSKIILQQNRHEAAEANVAGMSAAGESGRCITGLGEPRRSSPRRGRQLNARYRWLLTDCWCGGLRLIDGERDLRNGSRRSSYFGYYVDSCRVHYHQL
jgi:hypothetical protein